MANAVVRMFDPRGRANRAQMWLFHLIVVVAAIPVLGLAALVDNAPPEGPSVAAKTIFFSFLALCAAAFTTTAIRRLHDRNRSGRFLLVFYGPLVLGLLLAWFYGGKIVVDDALRWPATAIILIFGLLQAWAMVELFFLRGTAGENRYGPDPLAGRG